jgi:hypothetical protein
MDGRAFLGERLHRLGMVRCRDQQPLSGFPGSGPVRLQINFDEGANVVAEGECLRISQTSRLLSSAPSLFLAPLPVRPLTLFLGRIDALASLDQPTLGFFAGRIDSPGRSESANGHPTRRFVLHSVLQDKRLDAFGRRSHTKAAKLGIPDIKVTVSQRIDLGIGQYLICHRAASPATSDKNDPCST